jgi:hypothetical protein
VKKKETECLRNRHTLTKKRTCPKQTGGQSKCSSALPALRHHFYKCVSKKNIQVTGFVLILIDVRFQKCHLKISKYSFRLLNMGFTFDFLFTSHRLDLKTSKENKLVSLCYVDSQIGKHKAWLGSIVHFFVVA